MKNIFTAPVLLGAAVATVSPISAGTTGDRSKPNIVFILADDMGYECIGAYGGTYNTPNIDHLAEQGVKFNYAYAQPLSTPSRVELMTGKYNYKNYVDRFIETNKDQPFLLYYPMVLVHDPFVSTPQSSDWASNLEGRSKNNKKYFPDMMEYCDKMVGRVVDKLKKEGLYENTLIIFTGDNGTGRPIRSEMKDGSVIQGGKGLTTDAGTHVALIATYGSRQGQRKTCDDLIDFTDFLPTMAQAMDVAVPKEWGTDGVSFLPQIMGQKGTPRKWVFCHYDNFFNGPDKPDPNAKRYIRDYRYKLYSTGEFYDIQEDIFEVHNIVQGEGQPEAEKSRLFLTSELAEFPEWKAGDIPVQSVALQ